MQYQLIYAKICGLCAKTCPSCWSSRHFVHSGGLGTLRLRAKVMIPGGCVVGSPMRSYSCISGEIGHQILSTQSRLCCREPATGGSVVSFTVHLYRNSIQEGNWVCLTGATLRFRASRSAASVAGARSKDLRRATVDRYSGSERPEELRD